MEYDITVERTVEELKEIIESLRKEMFKVSKEYGVASESYGMDWGNDRLFDKQMGLFKKLCEIDAKLETATRCLFTRIEHDKEIEEIEREYKEMRGA